MWQRCEMHCVCLIRNTVDVAYIYCATLCVMQLVLIDSVHFCGISSSLLFGVHHHYYYFLISVCT